MTAPSKLKAEDMLKTYLSVSVRHIMQNKLFAAVNIAGLSIGLAAVLLIALYIWDELTFDSYLARSGDIYKLELKTQFPGRGPRSHPVTAGSTVPGLVADYPDLIETGARIYPRNSTVSIGDRHVSETVHFADASFFDLFMLDYAAGDAAAAQRDTATVAISESAAQRYFGAGPAVGETLRLDGGQDYRVGAVFAELPRNTHLRPQLIFPLLPSDGDNPAHDEGWHMIGYQSYVRLHDGVRADRLRAALPDFVDRYREPPAPDTHMSDRLGFHLIALKNVHFQTGAADAGNPLMLKGFAAVALVILSIATFNFMNMSVSRTVSRTREVAIRKVFGAQRRNIMSLFLNETLLMVLVSLLLAVVITELSLVWFNDFVAKLMTLGTLATPEFVAALVALVAVVCIGAGLYPAKILAQLRPANVLGGGRSERRGVSRLARLLVTLQFAVSIGLIITATTIYQQIGYSQSMDPGYTKENLLLIRGLGQQDVAQLQPELQRRVAALPGVTNAALLDQAPGGSYGWIDNVDVIDGVALPQALSVRGVSIGDGYVEAMGMQLAAGRSLTTAREADVARPHGSDDYRDRYNILINETALKTLGLGSADDAVGKTLGRGGTMTIVGVVEDYVWGTSKGTIPAAMYMMDGAGYRLLAVRFRTDNVSALTDAITQVWSGLAPERPIRLQFMDDRIAALYRQEQQQGEIFALFAALSVLVSCIGLYGLAAFTVAGRTKEIGIRKVLGATTASVTRHILWDFSKPVLIANLVAWPVAGLLMRDWLSGFTYRIDLGPVPFMVAALLALTVAALTVGGHALKVASANPVGALRAE